MHKNRNSHKDGKKKGISVIIPTCNRDEMLKKTLQSLKKQTLQNCFEIIISDNSGKSKIKQWIENDYGNPGYPIRYKDASGTKGPSFPRNVGAELAFYEYIAFIDDDAAAEPEWLAVIKDFFDTHPGVAILAGKMEASRLEHNLEYSRQYLYDSRDLHYRNKEKTAAIARKYNLPIPQDYYLADYFTAANCACRADVFETLGGFDPGIRQGQDHDLAIRCLQDHYEVAYVPEMRVRHEHGRSYRRFIKQTFRHGISTTARVVKLQKEHGYFREFYNQLVALKRETGNYLKKLKPGTDRRLRSSCFIMIMVRLLHISGTICYGFKISRKLNVL